MAQSHSVCPLLFLPYPPHHRSFILQLHRRFITVLPRSPHIVTCISHEVKSPRAGSMASPSVCTHGVAHSGYLISNYQNGWMECKGRTVNCWVRGDIHSSKHFLRRLFSLWHFLCYSLSTVLSLVMSPISIFVIPASYPLSFAVQVWLSPFSNLSEFIHLAELELKPREFPCN